MSIKHICLYVIVIELITEDKYLEKNSTQITPVEQAYWIEYE